MPWRAVAQATPTRPLMPCESRARPSGPLTLRQVLGEPAISPAPSEPRREESNSRQLLLPVPPVPDLQLPSTSPNSGPRMLLLSSNFLFTFGFDSVPPKLWEAQHLSFSSEECFLPWIQHLQSHLLFSSNVSGFLPPSPV